MRMGVRGVDSQDVCESYNERTILGVSLKVSSRARELEFLDEALASKRPVNVAFATRLVLLNESRATERLCKAFRS